ncbi:hypothetical protein PR003_g13122 [Phytophthora rubi]|uniref:Uncharacterized protein n=1 Tax=Phytophthora rubi TaxID=129364 RepID=A0A6A3LWR0_9STRA|nr:hypothetical protein PR002_g12557 [Phytophthora rubi]KAE9025892.1 hypothetical protein PR001_g12315 [Phytophthora rubi]KAE9335213.1 hypothetical protein PR003_g13122 [Phytophthora rubi]
MTGNAAEGVRANEATYSFVLEPISVEQIEVVGSRTQEEVCMKAGHNDAVALQDTVKEH